MKTAVEGVYEVPSSVGKEQMAKGKGRKAKVKPEYDF
jgi:hypothetical protein